MVRIGSGVRITLAPRGPYGLGPSISSCRRIFRLYRRLEHHNSRYTQPPTIQPNTKRSHCYHAREAEYLGEYASSNPTSFWLDSTPVVPYLAHSDQASKIGLENGTLYDVVSRNGGKGSVSLNATTFNVSCGYVDGASATDSGASGNWSIGTSYQGAATSIPVLAPNTFKWLPLYPYTLRDPWQHAVFYTSANITDSNGSDGVHISLNPPMQPCAYMDKSRKNVSDFSEAVVPSIQIIGCTISLINQSAAVDGESHLLQHVSPSGVKSTSQWLS